MNADEHENRLAQIAADAAAPLPPEAIAEIQALLHRRPVFALLQGLRRPQSRREAA